VNQRAQGGAKGGLQAVFGLITSRADQDDTITEKLTAIIRRRLPLIFDKDLVERAGEDLLRDRKRIG
jgi:hypothetical protein